MVAEGLWTVLQSSQSVHLHHTSYPRDKREYDLNNLGTPWLRLLNLPVPDTLASDTLVVVVEEWQLDIDTLSGERIEPVWPQRQPAVWQRHMAAVEEDDEEQTASERPAVRTDLRSSCWYRTAAGEQSPAGMVDNRLVSC